MVKENSLKDSKSLLTYPVILVIPAALENQITIENAALVQAKIIGGGSQWPSDPRMQIEYLLTKE